jgi:tetratricopeptide (TPR) repeat protein
MLGAVRKLLLAVYRFPGVTLLSIALFACVGLGGVFVFSYACAEYHYQAAHRALERRDYALALEHVTACLESRPDSFEAHFLAARRARLALDYREADRHLREFRRLGGVKEMFDLERQLARAQRGDLARVAGPLLLFAQRDHPESLQILEALSRGHLQEFRLEEALRCLGLWLERRPDDVQALLWRGKVWERVIQPGDAIVDYSRALELAPERDDDRLHLAGVLISSRRPAEAEGHLLLLAKQKSDDPKVLLGLAQCRRLQGKPDEARRLLEQVLELSPENGTAFAERGRLELEDDRQADAEPWLRKAVEQFPYERDLVYALSQCLHKTGRNQEAEKYEQRLGSINTALDRLDVTLRKISASSDNPGLRQEAGLIFIQNGQAEEGLRWLSSALRQDPFHGPTHQTLADYYDSIGQRGQAAWHRELAHQKQGKFTASAKGTPGRAEPNKAGLGG